MRHELIIPKLYYEKLWSQNETKAIKEWAYDQRNLIWNLSASRVLFYENFLII